jgi:hypothetical protein
MIASTSAADTLRRRPLLGSDSVNLFERDDDETELV